VLQEDLLEIKKIIFFMCFNKVLERNEYNE